MRGNGSREGVVLVLQGSPDRVDVGARAVWAALARADEVIE